MKAGILISMTERLRDALLEQSKKEHVHLDVFVRKMFKKYLKEFEDSDVVEVKTNQEIDYF